MNPTTVKTDKLLPYAGGLLMLAGFGIIGFQAIMWLKDGVWYSLPLSAFADPHAPKLAWVGAQMIKDWVLQLPLSLFFLFGGMWTLHYVDF